MAPRNPLVKAGRASILLLIQNGSLLGNSQNPRKVDVTLEVTRKMNSGGNSNFGSPLPMILALGEAKCFNIDVFQDSWFIPLQLILSIRKQGDHRHFSSSFKILGF